MALTELIGIDTGSQTITIEGDRMPGAGSDGLPMHQLCGEGRTLQHGEQAFDYQRAPRIGETLIGTGTISEVYEQSTPTAVMEFYVRETDWRDSGGHNVLTERFTLIVRRDRAA